MFGLSIKKKQLVCVRVRAYYMSTYIIEASDDGGEFWYKPYAAMFENKDAAKYHAYQWLGKKIKDRIHEKQGVVYSIDESGYFGELAKGLYDQELEEARARYYKFVGEDQ